MRSFLRTFLLTAVLGSLVWGFYFYVIRDSSVWYGVVTAVVFALAVATITKIRQNRVAASPPALTGDVILREGDATYGGMAGRMYLTDRRLLFEGYPTDYTAPEISTLFEGGDSDGPTHQVSIPVLRIAEIKPSALAIDSRFDVILTDGETKSFGTEDVAEWIDDISTTRQKVLDEPRSEDMKLFPAEK